MSRPKRALLLRGVDSILSFLLSPFSKTYAHGKNKRSFQTSGEELTSFAKKHGFFSRERPLVGKVTVEREDVAIVTSILEKIPHLIPGVCEALFATAEILAKVLAYRALEVGMKISLFTEVKGGDSRLVEYEVTHLIEIWHGIPAFGLMPKERGSAPPILLFRGTDLTLQDRGARGSVLSDLDPKGPGFSAFFAGRERIQAFLKEAKESGMKARAIGYSLGGNLALYTLLYETEDLNSTLPSIVFNVPGLFSHTYKLWQSTFKKKKAPLRLFVTEGDTISKVGKLVSPTSTLSAPERLGPLAAHVTLISFLPLYHSS
jgi:hypothetical protein